MKADRICHFRTASLMLAGTFIGGALGSVSALAQETAPQEGADKANPNPNDIVATARRTSERLSDVPVSVVALSGEQLAERRILSDADLQSATPGLTIRQTARNHL